MYIIVAQRGPVRIYKSTRALTKTRLNGPPQQLQRLNTYKELASKYAFSNNEVEKIGKINKGNQEVHGEFIGMIKLSDHGTKIFKENFHRLKKIYWNKPFQRAKIFQKAYLTDFIQELVDIGIKVHCVIIESGWKEIDTVEDYKKALVGFNKKFTKG